MIAVEIFTHTCETCGTHVYPGDHCDCPDGTCILCDGDLYESDCVLTARGPAHEDCGLAAYEERDSTFSLGLEAR